MRYGTLWLVLLAIAAPASGETGSPGPAEAHPATCTAACEERREREATEWEVIAAECRAACGTGPAVQELESEPGFAVVRGRLDVVDVPAPDELPATGFGILTGPDAYVLFCELDGLAPLYGRQVWTRAFVMPDPLRREGDPIGLRDCQGLAAVDEP